MNGLVNLRIVEASVFPITYANTNAPTMLLAAKGASVILKEQRIESTRSAKHVRNRPAALQTESK